MSSNLRSAAPSIASAAIPESEPLQSTAHQLLATHRLSTPFVMMDEAKLLEAVDRFNRHLPGVRLMYAVKANSAPGVLDLFHSRGLGFDVASAAEIELAISLGVSPSDLWASHPVKDPRTCHSLLRHRVRGFTVDNVRELHKLSRIPRDYTPDVFIRIKTESEDVELDLNDKFGCRLQDAPLLAETARELGFNPVGLTFHVGTQSYLASNYETALEHCKVVANVIRERTGIELTVINMGGGYCDEQTALKHGRTVDAVLADIGAIVKKVQDAGFTVIAEPGRSLVTSSGTLVTQVIGIHDRGQSRIVHIDDGVYGVLSGQIFDYKKYTLEPLARISSREQFEELQVSSTVCGRTCDSIDILTGQHHLPADINVGDHLLVRNVGAYGSVCGCTFNGFDVASTVVYSVEGGEVIVKDHSSTTTVTTRRTLTTQDERETIAS